MKQSTRSKVITRAIHFIATNTNNDSKRIGSAIIEELKLLEKSTNDESYLEYILKFALEVIGDNDLQNTKNKDNWKIGESIEKEIEKLNDKK